MHRFTVLGPLCSRTKTRFTSLTRLGMSTHLTSIARGRRIHGKMEDVVAILVVASVSHTASS